MHIEPGRKGNAIKNLIWHVVIEFFMWRRIVQTFGRGIVGSPELYRGDFILQQRQNLLTGVKSSVNLFRRSTRFERHGRIIVLDLYGGLYVTFTAIFDPDFIFGWQQGRFVWVVDPVGRADVLGFDLKNVFDFICEVYHGDLVAYGLERQLVFV